MELVDCHTHTRHSDGRPSVEENVARACELGLATIACTDHFTLPAAIDPACEVSVWWEDLASYERDVLAARAAHPGIDVVYGFECDWYPGCEAYIDRLRGGATFLLGSVHLLGDPLGALGPDTAWGWIDDGDDLSYWDEHGTEEVWRRYFDAWCRACSSPAGFSSMAHPDLVRKFGRVPTGGALVARLHDEAAQAAAAAGVRVEVSSAGARTAAGGFYPDADLLARFCAAGVPITVGSDAHDAARVGERIRDLYAYAHEAGYRRVDVPTPDGGWREVAL